MGDKAGNLGWNQVMECLECFTNEHEHFGLAMENY